MARARPHEVQPGTLAGLGEVAVFGKKAVAGMDGVGAVGDRRADHRRDVQVAVLGRGRTDADRFVSHPHMHRVLVGGGVNGNGRDSEFAAGADYPDCDRATICDQ